VGGSQWVRAGGEHRLWLVRGIFCTGYERAEPRDQLIDALVSQKNWDVRLCNSGYFCYMKKNGSTGRLPTISPSTIPS
jgi:hypothetical protein